MAPRPPGPDYTSTAPTASDTRGLKARARSADTARAAAYKRGQADAAAGRNEPPFDEELAGYYSQGHDAASASRPADSGQSSPGAAPPTAPASSKPLGGLLGSSSGSKVDSGAGLVLGAIAYALVVNFLRGGMPAVKGWFAAKFLNHPYTGPLNASSYSTPAQPAAPVPNTPVGPPVGVPSILGQTP